MKGGVIIKKSKSNYLIGILLVIISITIYLAQIFIFGEVKNTLFYLFQDLAFVPIQLIIVTLIIEKIFNAKEKQERIKKLNIIKSAFYSEIGSTTLLVFETFVINLNDLKKILEMNVNWRDEDYHLAIEKVRNFDFVIESNVNKLQTLKTNLIPKKLFMLGMFQNPNLLEHDAFTDMLWSVFHVIEELENRDSFETLPNTDIQHLSNDINRAIPLIIIEWIQNMRHLKKEYPYLYSLALRKSPFCNENKIIIT